VVQNLHLRVAILAGSPIRGRHTRGRGILLAIAVTGDDREARIFRKAGIDEGEFAKDKNGAAIRRDLTGVEAIGAKTGEFTLAR
jgi:hypothetical protein